MAGHTKAHTRRLLSGRAYGPSPKFDATYSSAKRGHMRSIALAVAMVGR
jgi:hypothetical protein